MTIEQLEVIDFASFGPDSDEVVLTITDHLVWDQNQGEHLLLLQEKLNAYLQFIESGQLYEHYPQVRGRNVVISLANKFPLSDQANRFFGLAGEAIANAGFSLKLAFPEGGENVLGREPE